MASITQLGFILLTCWSFNGQFMAEGVSENILKLMTIFNGKFDNTLEIISGNEFHYFLQVMFLPVELSALPGKSVSYFEEAIDGDIVRRMFLEFAEGTDGIIYGTPYDFTDSSLYNPETFSPFALPNFTAADLVTGKECTVTFVHVAPALYTVTWPDCKDAKTDGKYPTYNVTTSCSDATLFVPVTSRERTDDVPYSFQLHGDRFPLLGDGAGYVGICNKSG